MLKNRYYVGVVKYEGVEYPGKHEPLISEQLYAEVQRVRTSRHQSREKPRVHTHYLKGSVYCGNCGEPLTFERSRSRSGQLYDYFYCLGRQRLKNGCMFKAIQAHHVEDLIERHWSTVTIDADRLQSIRELVLDHLSTLLPTQSRAQDEAQTQLITLKRQSDRLMQAYYADAIDVSHLKQEQSKIAAATAHAEATLRRHATSEDLVVQKLTELCAVLADAQTYYRSAPNSLRRDLNQGMFDHLYIFDDEMVGSDLTEPYQRLLSDSLAGDLASERKRVQSELVRTSDLYLVPGVGESACRGDATSSTDLPSRHRRTSPEGRLGASLRLERPRGALPWERKNPGPVKVRGSNELLLVAGAGFEPATSGL
ncbi:hypothetical protein EUA06_09760 [Nocardioides glacieisoli]|uniref:Importin N-terminal domain-containing protein n=1 Tax=Nocardioides glacieisoli TaxID=1168730 RepID=A0A4V1RKA7_9ACTN|nr:hypothetical protein EUA06_09760 [Nocardioides glacieisoli]